MFSTVHLKIPSSMTMPLVVATSQTENPPGGAQKYRMKLERKGHTFSTVHLKIPSSMTMPLVVATSQTENPPGGA